MDAYNTLIRTARCKLTSAGELRRDMVASAHLYGKQEVPVCPHLVGFSLTSPPSREPAQSGLTGTDGHSAFKAPNHLTGREPVVSHFTAEVY